MPEKTKHSTFLIFFLLKVIFGTFRFLHFQSYLTKSNFEVFSWKDFWRVFLLFLFSGQTCWKVGQINKERKVFQSKLRFRKSKKKYWKRKNKLESILCQKSDIVDGWLIIVISPSNIQVWVELSCEIIYAKQCQLRFTLEYIVM